MPRRPRPALRPGDRVAVVAPSGPVPADRLEAGCAWLRTLGLDVQAGCHVLDTNGYLAGSDAARAADLQSAWCHPDVRAVICARGGYGATRLLPLLDWDALAAAGPKLLHGSSDVTALLNAFAVRVPAVPVFGPMPAGELLGVATPDQPSAAAARAVWFGAGRWTAPGTGMLVPGRATGTLVGGNLALLAAMVGTPYAPVATGGVVLLEDVREPPYRVDRMLTQLLQAGWFDGVRGIALGQFTGCGAADEVLAERLTPLGVPILTGIAVGHGRPQLSVVLGDQVELDADAQLLRRT